MTTVRSPEFPAQSIRTSSTEALRSYSNMGSKNRPSTGSGRFHLSIGTTPMKNIRIKLPVPAP